MTDPERPPEPLEEQARAAERAIDCPFCGAADLELIAPFGSQLLVSQYRCRACRSYFEAVRDDR